jgi:hypothetical protein
MATVCSNESWISLISRARFFNSSSDEPREINKLGPGFITWTNANTFPCSIHTTDTFISSKKPDGFQWIDANEGGPLSPVSDDVSLESFLRNRTIRSPVTKRTLFFCFSYEESETARDDCGLNDASSGILTVSPGLRSPFHDSTTRNTPSIVLPSVATTM